LVLSGLLLLSRLQAFEGLLPSLPSSIHFTLTDPPLYCGD
jgi:hypothetical protein